MTTAVPPIPRTPAARLRWALADGWTVTRRDLTHWRHRPGDVAVALLFPVLMVLMFGYLLGGGIAVPGGGDYREFLMPGMFAMTMLFGIETTFAAVATDAARGVTDRFRSLPMAPSAVVTGRATADMTHSALGLAVMIGCGLAVGWRSHGDAGDTLLAIALLLLLRLAFLWIGIYLGLLARGPESLAAVQILVWPVGFLSNAFVPTATMPAWLGTLAEWNPLSSTVTAVRALFGNPGTGDSWIAQHALPMAVAWPALLIAIFFPLSVRCYRRLDR
ncbi:ABC transporter permease [Microtetraspora sp. AC03309]|uniref:ABC transporter permease n=1 Tax=Microtetraspora sp. AC03309 TaxID=2779376 RepID=UPI001E339E58|nr:ABC transporter permease [Microtetraspora sp. AC03309]MCC5575352.1 ABC transporter permease [Microtetraspora sp. AC03309]